MEERGKTRGRATTILMILIVLMMPVYTANVFAERDYRAIEFMETDVGQASLFSKVIPLEKGLELGQAEEYMPLFSLKEVEARGKDNASDIRRMNNDYVILKAILGPENDGNPIGVQAEQVWLGQSRHFDRCSQPTGTDWECEIRIPATGTNSLEHRSYTYSVYYFSDEYIAGLGGGLPDTRRRINSKEAKVYVDNLKPQINTITPIPRRIGSGNFTFTYNIADRSCPDIGCAGGCAGIKEIIIKDSNDQVIVTENVTIEGCSISSSFQAEGSKFSQGTNNVKFIAKDRVDLESDPYPVELFLDAQPPSISQSGVVIEDLEGNNINYVPGGEITITVKVDILDDDLDVSRVSADFSSIRPGYNSMIGQCGVIPNGFECSWIIAADFSQATSQAFIVKAYDKFSNLVEQNLNLGLTVDTDSPVITSIISDRQLGGQSYVGGQDRTLVVNFQETGSGFTLKKVWMDLGGIGLGRKQADRCEQGWSCYFENITIPSLTGRRVIAVTSDSSDDAGNIVTGERVVQLMADSTPPVIQDVVVTVIHGATGRESPYPATGDVLEISVTLEEESSVAGFANLSTMISAAGAERFQGQCQETSVGDIWSCVFTTPTIDMSGPYDTTFTLSFLDFSGNLIEHTEQISVLGVIGGTGNYWQSSTECMPELVDRQVAPFVNYRIYCRINLNSPNAEWLELNLGTCSGNGSSYVNSDRLIVPDDSTTGYPIIELILDRGEYRISEISLQCPLSIRTRVGQNVIQQPELEQVPVKIEFFSLPLGEFSEEVDSKIDAAREKAEGLWGILGMLKMLFFYAEKICRILELWHKITLALHVFDKEVTALAIAFKGTPASPALEAESIVTCEGAEAASDAGKGMFGFMDKFCAFVNCKAARPKDEPASGGKGFLGGAVDSIANWEGFGMGDAEFGGTWGLTYGEYVDAKNNLLVAILTGCIPGIIYGLDKWRQIECAYGVCLQEAVKGDGVPISTCDEQKEYQTCKYIWGEIFAVIPWTAFFNHVIGIIKNALSDPLSALGIGIGFFCKVKCVEGDSGAKLIWKFGGDGFCGFMVWLNLFGEIIGEVMNILNPDSWKINDDMCSILGESEED